jgi:septal ring factor EnvC (AmiA/AmiB activator)
MSLYQLSKRIDKRYAEMTPNQKSLTFIGIIVLILLLLGMAGWIIFSNQRQSEDVERYINKFEESKQNYYLATIANSNLEKKLQELNLRLAETINSTIALQRMISELDSENVSLEAIRKELEKGLQRTKSQLDKMQGSVNYLIDQRENQILETGEKLKIEKSNTHGKY